MTITILTSKILPFSDEFGATQRMYYLAEYLSSSGVNVTAISVFGGLPNNYGKKFSYSAIVLAENKNESPNQNDCPNVIFRRLKKFVLYAYNFIFSEMSPGISLRALLIVVKKRNEIIKHLKEKKSKILIISCPNFSVLAIAPFVKRILPGIRIVYDYRDPWTLWPRSSLAARKLEQYLHRYADAVVFSTDSLRVKMLQIFDLNKKSVECVLNGFSAMDWGKISINSNNPFVSKEKKLILSYVGAIGFKESSYRSPIELIEAVAELKDFIDLYFVGAYIDSDAIAIKEKYPFVNMIPQVDHIDSLQYIKNSDALINIHMSVNAEADYVVQGKFYDYIKSGNPIINITNTKNFISDYIDLNNVGFNCYNDKKSIKEVLTSLISLRCQCRNKAINNYTSHYSREYQNEKYRNFLLGII